MTARRIYGHSPDDIHIAAGREAFAGLLFAYFDRMRWWQDRKKPLRRLSGMLTASGQNVERWLLGTMPDRESLRELENVVGIPVPVLEFVLRHNRMPGDDDVPVATNKATLHADIEELDDDEAGELVPVVRRYLLAKRRDTPRGRVPIAGEASPAG